MRFLLPILLLLSLPLHAQGQLDVPISAELAQARQDWLNGDYDGIWDVIRPEAEAGNPVAQNLMGVGLSKQDSGQGIAYDPTAALEWWALAEAQGYERARYNHALFWSEEHEGFEVDFDRTRALALEAMENGYTAAASLIGDLHHAGKGTPVDKAEALRWYRLSADAGNFNGLRQVGYAYFHGEGVTKDVGLTVAYLERAIAAGDKRSIRDLAWLLEGNEGIKADLLKSYLLYQMGVERGDAASAYELGLFMAWEDYPGFWHDPVKGYGYCLLSLDWGYSNGDDSQAEECAKLAEPLSETQRTQARAIADALQ